jgi:hypothetical protein
VRLSNQHRGRDHHYRERDITSTAANRFNTAGGADALLTARRSIQLVLRHDPGQVEWHRVGGQRADLRVRLGLVAAGPIADDGLSQMAVSHTKNR